MSKFICHIILLFIFSSCAHSDGKLQQLLPANTAKLNSTQGRKIAKLAYNLHPKLHFLGWIKNPVTKSPEFFFQYNIYQEHDFNTYNFEIWQMLNKEPILRFSQNKYRDITAKYYYYTREKSTYFITESHNHAGQFLEVEIYRVKPDGSLDALFDLANYMEEIKSTYLAQLEIQNGELYISNKEGSFLILFKDNGEVEIN